MANVEEILNLGDKVLLVNQYNWSENVEIRQGENAYIEADTYIGYSMANVPKKGAVYDMMGIIPILVILGILVGIGAAVVMKR